MFGTEKILRYPGITEVSSLQGVLIRLGVHKFTSYGSLQAPHIIEDNFTHAPHSGVSGVDKQVNIQHCGNFNFRPST